MHFGKRKKMYRIAICDDEIAICAQFEKILLDYREAAHVEMTIDIYFSAEELYRFLLDGVDYDILFLDIEFKQENGIQVGERIRDELRNETMQIVYISGKQSYAIDLFNTRPLNFLVKPLDYQKVIQVFRKGMELSNKKHQYFTYKQGKNIKKILVKDILYFESLNRQVRMKTVRDTAIFYGSLEDIYEELHAYQFFYIHKSYLVNYNHIIEFYYEKVIMSDRTALPISQSRRKAMRDVQIRIEKGE